MLNELVSAVDDGLSGVAGCIVLKQPEYLNMFGRYAQTHVSPGVENIITGSADRWHG